MKNIFVLGDSISLHYGPYLERFLSGVMRYSRKEGEEKAVVQLDQPLVANANGGDSGMCLEYLRQKIQEPLDPSDNLYQADFILFNAGLHDIKIKKGSKETQVPLEEYEQNLKHIIELIQQSLPKAELIWIRTTPLDEKIHNARQNNFQRYEEHLLLYNETADRLMAQYQIRGIDIHLFTLNIGRPTAIFCDHIHFHNHVREKQAAFIAGWLSANTT